MLAHHQACPSMACCWSSYFLIKTRHHTAVPAIVTHTGIVMLQVAVPELIALSMHAVLPGMVNSTTSSCCR